MAILLGTNIETLLADFAMLLLISPRGQFEVRQRLWLDYVSTLHIVRLRRCILSVLRQVLWRLGSTACLYLLELRIFRTTPAGLSTSPRLTASRSCSLKQ